MKEKHELIVDNEKILESGNYGEAYKKLQEILFKHLISCLENCGKEEAELDVVMVSRYYTEKKQ
jgi:hypothetical protein